MPISRTASLFGWSLIIVASLFIVVSSIGTYSLRKFESRVKQLRESGEIPSLDDLVHVVENEQDDMKYHLMKVINDNPNLPVTATIPYGKQGNIIVDTESILQFELFQTEHNEIFVNLAKAANAPEASTKVTLDGDHFPIVQAHNLLQFLVWKGKVLVAKNDGQSACEVAEQLLQIGNKFKRTFLLDTILAMSLQQSAWDLVHETAKKGMLPDVDLKTLQVIDDLSNCEDNMQIYESIMRSEMAVVTHMMLNPEALPSRTEQNGHEPSHLASFVNQIPSGAAMVAGNTYLDHMMIAIEHSQAQLTEQIGLAEKHYRWNILAAFDGDPLPAYLTFRSRFGEHIAFSRAMRVLLALHHSADAQNRDAWPAEYLASLDLPNEITLDPFTNEAMIVKRQGETWQVYSVGSDFEDAGGDAGQDAGVGLTETCQDEPDQENED